MLLASVPSFILRFLAHENIFPGVLRTKTQNFFRNLCQLHLLLHEKLLGNSIFHVKTVEFKMFRIMPACYSSCFLHVDLYKTKKLMYFRYWPNDKNPLKIYFYILGCSPRTFSIVVMVASPKNILQLHASILILPEKICHH